MALVFAGPATALAEQSPAATGMQQTEAIAKPSVVFIQTHWHGYLTRAMFGDVNIGELLSGEAGTAPEFSATTTCSGFVANPQYVVTAGHCVDDQSVAYGGKGVIIEAAMAELASSTDLSASNLATIQDYAYKNWTVEGTEKGSPPDRVVGVFPTQAASGIVVSTPFQANVISFRSFDKGDVALLKIDPQTPLPVLEVAPGATAAQGTPVVAAGYPGSVSQSVDPKMQPSMKDGEISGQQDVNGVPVTEISAATSPGMSGGPVVDAQGRVVGTVSWKPGSETQPFNFITDTSTIRDILASNGVANTLGPADQAYRAGLDHYFAGQYHAAVADFDQVLALQPSHAQAQNYKTLAITNYPKEPAGSSNVLLFVLIGAGVLVIAAAAATFVVIRKRRRGGATAVTPQGVPGAVPPAQGPPPQAESLAPAQPAAGAPAAEKVTAEQPAAEQVTADHVTEEGSAPAPHDRFCPFCGEPHEAGAHFCASCGFHFPVKATHKEGGAS
jgi:V8-like Glu-specific endopeptidase